MDFCLVSIFDIRTVYTVMRVEGTFHRSSLPSNKKRSVFLRATSSGKTLLPPWALLRRKDRAIAQRDRDSRVQVVMDVCLDFILVKGWNVWLTQTPVTDRPAAGWAGAMQGWALRRASNVGTRWGPSKILARLMAV